MSNSASAREELRKVGCNLPHQSSVMLKLLSTREFIITIASEGTVPEASHYPVVGMSRCFLELAGWQEALKHANFSFHTKIKEGTFVGSFCFPVTLGLMQSGSLCQDEHDALALLLTMVLAEGQGVCRTFAGRKLPIMRQLGRCQTLNTGSGMGSTMKHFYMDQLTKSIPGKKKFLL